MTDELAPDAPLPPAVALTARDPLLPFDTKVARNTIPPHSVPIKHPISSHAFREITNFIRDNGDDWEEFYTSKHTTTTTDKTIGKIKKKKLRLPHPCSLDVLPSPTDKWSATTHPIKAWIVGYLGYHISYKHFFFHQVVFSSRKPLPQAPLPPLLVTVAHQEAALNLMPSAVPTVTWI